MSGALLTLQLHCELRRGKARRLSPRPLPAGGSPLRFRSGQVSVDEGEHFQDHPGMPFGFPSEKAFSFAAIPTDGRKLPTDPQPLWYGYSAGEGHSDTLVVETAGFNDKS
jgi:hypothetical protein